MRISDGAWDAWDAEDSTCLADELCTVGRAIKQVFYCASALYDVGLSE